MRALDCPLRRGAGYDAAWPASTLFIIAWVTWAVFMWAALHTNDSGIDLIFLLLVGAGLLVLTLE
jgi:hypothetical protein